MLYRFADAGTDARDRRRPGRDRRRRAAGALTGAASYLTVKQAAERTAATFVPFVVAFGVLGLVMSVLIIGIVVSGAVSAATRRIGILKALGFTPAQVARAYVGQALIPAASARCSASSLGNLAAIPVLPEEGDAFGTGVAVTLAPWVDVVVPIGALVAGRGHRAGAGAAGRPAADRRRARGRPHARPPAAGRARPAAARAGCRCRGR